MKDFVIEECQQRDTRGIIFVAKENNYFNPNYKNYEKSGFTGTVYNPKTVKEIIKLGYSFKISFGNKIIGYFLGADKNGYFKVFREKFEDLSKNFSLNKNFIPKNVIYSPQTAVLPEFKGRGIAHEIFSNVKSEYKRQGFSSIYAEILSNNEGSIKFWEQVGFKKIADRIPENITFFKGCDEEWIKKNYQKLLSNKDKRVNQKMLSNLKWILYKYSIV